MMRDACRTFGCIKRALSDGWCADHHAMPRVLLAVDDKPAPTYADVLVAERDAYKKERDQAIAELAEARRQLGEAVEVQEDLAGKLFDAVQERDAYRDGRYAGPWLPVADHHNGEGYSRAGAAFVGRRRDGRYEWNCAGFKSALVETAAEAKAAADAHLIAAGWFLAGGPHGAGEAK